jgi:NAD(P)-dependent dehydrogenase (short-subunit alcohol dehydrogenase family)
MKTVAVITGGAGGMGLATAKILGQHHHVVISDVVHKRLEEAIGELKNLGCDATAIVCDVIDEASVDGLMKQAAALGTVVSVIHTAGVSPQMTDARMIMKINALGTVNVTNACYDLAQEEFSLINVASMAAHMLPSLLLPQRAYPLATTHPDAFLKRATWVCRLMPNKLYQNGLAYGISKHFVIWFSRTSAARFGKKGARVMSVSPGSFDTEMGRLEEKSGSAEMLKTAALKRFGRPEEIAEVLAFCASPKASYLTGTDILCDGGVVAGRER